MPPESLRCKECKTSYPLDARYVCERCFGPLEVAYATREATDPAALRRRIQAGPHSIWRYADFLPVAPAEVRAARRVDAAGARRPTRAGSSGSASCGSRTTPRTRRTRSRTGSSSVALARAQELGFTTIACASTGNLANAVAAHAAAAGLESYVFIPSDLEEQKVLATGVYGTNLVAVRGNYDDVNRLCTELSGEHDWAFVNINMRPYYAEGSKTLAFEIAEQLGFEMPDRIVVPDRLGLAVHEDRARVRGVDRTRAAQRQTAALQRRAGRRLLAGRDGVRGRTGLLPAGQAEHDRQVAGDRQSGRRPVCARARAAHWRRDRRGHRRRDPGRHPPARDGRPGSSPRPPAA